MDTVKTSAALQITYALSDGSSDILTLDNASASITGADIASLNSFLADNNVIIGAGNATFTAITDARTIGSEKTILDLT